LCRLANPAASFVGLAGCLRLSLETLTREEDLTASVCMIGKWNTSGQPLGAKWRQEKKAGEVVVCQCISDHCRAQSTYLLTNISKFCKKKVGFRILLGVLPPGIRFWHEARRDSVDSFQRLKFALTHMLPCGTQCNNLRIGISCCICRRCEVIQP